MLYVCAASCQAHPHVFVDGGVDFVFGQDQMLEALDITWIYDEFETLYILSSHGLSLNTQGDLDEADRQALVRFRSDWPSDFDGSAHLTVGGESVSMAWPTGLDAHLENGRLRVTFSRRLEQPVRLGDATAEVAFYESTYFYAFSITQQPQPIERCRTDVVPFDPNAQDKDLQATLARLSREETPAINNVGALFADRIVLKCA